MMLSPATLRTRPITSGLPGGRSPGGPKDGWPGPPPGGWPGGAPPAGPPGGAPGPIIVGGPAVQPRSPTYTPREKAAMATMLTTVSTPPAINSF
ncbi:MAG TPA: hypothetical protein EYP49_11600 [Anaerolineae bacterium]|nr:hypothetical protein [Anaerolineae bacterium]